MKRRGMLVAGIASLVLAAVIAASAFAGIGEIPMTPSGQSHGLKYAGGTFSDPTTGSIYIRGACEAGENIIGGGSAWHSAPARKTIMRESRPTDGDDAGSETGDSWAAEGSFTTPENPDYSVYTVCAKREMTYPFDDVAATEGQKPTATAVCPQGTSVTSGGPVASGNLATPFISKPADGSDGDVRPDDAWVVRSLVAGNAVVSSVASCVNDDPGELKYVNAKGRVRAGRAKTLSPDCPNSKAVTGGGVQISGKGRNRWISSARPTDSPDPNSVADDRYSSTVFNGTNAPKPVTAWAICLG